MLAVFMFASIDREAFKVDGLKLDGTRLFDVILNIFDGFNFGGVKTNCQANYIENLEI